MVNPRISQPVLAILGINTLKSIQTIVVRLLILSVAFFIPVTANAERIKDLASIEGVRDNPLLGYGLVVGLDGTGDQTSSVVFTEQSLRSMLTQYGITVPPDVAL